MDSGHSVSDKLEPDKEKFCVVQGSGQWWVSNTVQQNFGQLYVRCWPKYDLTGIWGWTNVLYDLKLRRFRLGVALKTNTWGLVLAGSREAERITSQIEQGQWTKKQQRKGSVTFNIFSIFSVWLLSSDQYIDIPIKLFSKKMKDWRGPVESCNCNCLTGEKNTIFIQFDRVFYYVHTAFVQRVGGTSDTLNILIMEEPFRAIFRLHTHNRILHSFSM